MRVIALVLWLASPAAAAERLAVIVGADLGAPDEEPLRHAEADARRVRDVLVELAGVQQDRALLLAGPQPNAVLAALDEARGRAAELHRAGKRVELVFYFSGHGDDGSLHLARGDLALADVRRALAAVPADLRLAVIDACRGGVHLRGVGKGTAFAVAAAPDAPHGSVEIHAAAAGEAAQESDELGGAVFTHFIVSGLRGAADQDADGRVTLDELYRYAYRHTLLRTGASDARQHPDFAMSLAGAGEVVLSVPGKTSASLEVPRGAAWYLVFALPSAAVLGEIGGEGGRLALPNGRFLVVRHAGAASGVAEVDLSWGGHRVLSDGDFRPVAREELVARGGALELRPFRIEPRAGLEFSPGSALPLAMRTGAAFGWGRGAVALGFELAYLGGAVDTRGYDGDAGALAIDPVLSLRGFAGPLELAASAGFELRWTWQHLVRRDASRVTMAGLAASEDTGGGSAGPRAAVGMGVPLGHHLTATLAASYALLATRETQGTGATSLATESVVGVTSGVAFSF